MSLLQGAGSGSGADQWPDTATSGSRTKDNPSTAWRIENGLDRFHPVWRSITCAGIDRASIPLIWKRLHDASTTYVGLVFLPTTRVGRTVLRAMRWSLRTSIQPIEAIGGVDAAMRMQHVDRPTGKGARSNYLPHCGHIAPKAIRMTQQTRFEGHMGVDVESVTDNGSTRATTRSDDHFPDVLPLRVP